MSPILTKIFFCKNKEKTWYFDDLVSPEKRDKLKVRFKNLFESSKSQNFCKNSF